MIALVSDILQLSELDSNQASRSREPVTEMAPVIWPPLSRRPPEHDGQRPPRLCDAAV